MALFQSPRYPFLVVGVRTEDGEAPSFATFVDGRYETDDARVADRLRGIANEYGLVEVDAPTSEEPAAAGEQKPARRPRQARSK